MFGLTLGQSSLADARRGALFAGLLKLPVLFIMVLPGVAASLILPPLDNGERAPMPLAAGDKVIFGKYAGTEGRVEGEEYKILELRDVLAKFQ